MEQKPESMLALDVGNAYVKAVLLDSVGDECRFIARGTAPQVARSSGGPVGNNWLEAVRELERSSGRRLLTADNLPLMPEELSAGVDAVAGTVGAIGQLRVAIASLGSEFYLNLAQAALRSVPYVVTALITGKEISARADAFERFAKSIRDDTPHVILLVGGSERKPDRVMIAMAEAIGVAVSLLRPQTRPALIYAGPQALRSGVTAALAERIALRMVDNVSLDDQTANLESLRSELDSLYLQVVLKDGGGVRLKRWFGGNIISLGRALSQAYGHPQVNILAADVGAETTTIVRPQRGDILIEPECGVSQGAAKLWERLGPEPVLRWLTGETDEKAVADWVANRETQPWLRASNALEREIELAFARESLCWARRLIPAAWPGQTGSDDCLQADLAVCGGGFVADRHTLVLAALAIIDGLQPAGVCRLALDWANLAPSLGALAEMNPEAVRSVLEKDAILSLGTLIAPIGREKAGRPALRLEITMPDGQTQETNIDAGSLLRLPLAPGLRAKAVIRPTRQFQVGGAAGEAFAVTLEGGPLGVIIDVRGRPLPDIAKLPDRINTLRNWQMALGG